MSMLSGLILAGSFILNLSHHSYLTHSSFLPTSIYAELQETKKEFPTCIRQMKSPSTFCVSTSKPRSPSSSFNNNNNNTNANANWLDVTPQLQPHPHPSLYPALAGVGRGQRVGRQIHPSIRRLPTIKCQSRRSCRSGGQSSDWRISCICDLDGEQRA